MGKTEYVLEPMIAKDIKKKRFFVGLNLDFLPEKVSSYLDLYRHHDFYFNFLEQQKQISHSKKWSYEDNYLFELNI